MAKSFLPVVAALVVLSVTPGCANVENKFGRGMRNTIEWTRMGDLRRSMEQTALTEGGDVAFTTGLIKGVNKTMVRTGAGIFEMVTAPFKPYDPVLPDYLSEYPEYPDNYAPRLIASPIFETDTFIGFGGGDVAPFVPGSRFFVFDY